MSQKHGGVLNEFKVERMACTYFAQVKDEIYKDSSPCFPQRSSNYLALCIHSGQSFDLARRAWRVSHKGGDALSH
jgi:hypothetical protein